MESKVLKSHKIQARVIELKTHKVAAEVDLIHGSCLMFSANCHEKFAIELVKKQPSTL